MLRCGRSVVSAPRGLAPLLEPSEITQQSLHLGKLIALETAELQRCTREFRAWWTHDRAADLKARFWQEVSPSELRCA